MKLLVVIIILKLIIYCELKAVEWQKIETGTDKDISRISFYNDLNGWLCGDDGLLMKSLDGGKNWIDLSKNDGVSLNSIFFLENGKGWIAGRNGTILHINQQGLTETITKQESGTDKFIFKIFFLNENIGWAVGIDGFVIKTSNGGNSWELIREGESGLHLWSIYFIDEMNGWAVGEKGLVLKSSDGGLSWNQISSPSTFRYLDVQFVDENNGWISGFELIARTSNGGNTWINIFTSSSSYIVSKIFMLDEQRGWFSLDKNYLLYTTDGGDNLNMIGVPNDMEFINNFSYHDGKLFVVGPVGQLYMGETTVSVNQGIDEAPDFVVVVDKDFITLKSAIDLNEIVEVSMISILGNIIFTEDYNFSNNININISNITISKGVYFVKIKSRKGITVKKVIV